MPDVVKTLQVEIDAKVNDGQAKKQLDDLAKDRKATIKTDLQGAKEAGKQMDNLTKDKEVELKINENFMKQFEKLGRDVTDILSNMQKITEEGGNMGFGEDGIKTLGRFKDKLDGIEDTLKSIGEKMKIEKLEPSSAYDIRIDALKSRIDFVKKNEGKLKRLQKELTGETPRGKTIKTDDEDDPRLFGKKLAANINKGYGIDGLAEEQYKQYIISLKRYMDLGGDIDVPLSFSFDTDKGTVKGTETIRGIIDELNGLGEMHVDLDKYIPTKSVKTLEQNLANLEAKRERAIAKESGRALTVGLDDITIDNLVNKFKEAKSAADEFFESLKTNGKFDFGEEGLGKSINDMFANIKNISNLMDQIGEAKGIKKVAKASEDAGHAMDTLKNNSQNSKFIAGDHWGSAEIQQLIDSLQQLQNAMQSISTALGTIDDESQISTMLEQFNNLGSVIETAFNSDRLEQFSSAMLDIVKNINQLSSSLGVINPEETSSVIGLLDGMQGGGGINVSLDSSGKEKSVWRQASKRYETAYDNVFKIFENQRKDYGTAEYLMAGLYGGSSKLRQTLAGRNYEEALSRYNVIDVNKDAEQRVQSIADFLKNVKTATDEMLDSLVLNRFQNEFEKERDDVLKKTGETIGWGDWKSKHKTKIENYLKKSEDAQGYYDINKWLKSSASPDINFESVKRQVNDIVKQEGGENGEESFMDLIGHLKDISNLRESLSKLGMGLMQGLGIQQGPEKDGGFKSYLSEIVSQMNDVSGLAGKLSESLSVAVKDVFGQESAPIDLYFNPIVDDIRGKIESELAEPFKIDIKANTDGLKDGIQDAKKSEEKSIAQEVKHQNRQTEQATSLTDSESYKELKDFSFINDSFILDEPMYDFQLQKLIEKGGQLEQILQRVFTENPGSTLQTVIDAVQQELTDTTAEASNFDNILSEIRKGSKKWTFNDLLTDRDGFAKDLNGLSDQLVEIREAGGEDSKEALNLETRIQSMLKAQSKLLDPNYKSVRSYYDEIQNKLSQKAQAIEDEMWEAMANGGDLTSKNDFGDLVSNRLGLDFSKVISDSDISNLQGLLGILKNIDTIRGRISNNGQMQFYDKQVKENLNFADTLKQRLINTPDNEKQDDPEWVENQYKYIAEHLQKAEEYKKKIADIKGESYEMQNFTAESVKSSMESSDGEIDALKQKTKEIAEEGKTAQEAAAKKKEFADANEKITTVTDSTPVQEQSEAITKEGDAAEEATKKKEDFASANDKVATATDHESIEQASDAIQDEGEAASKAAKEKEDFAKANDSFLNLDKAKQDAEELEGAYNETGAAIKSYLDSIESTKLDPSQWEEALRIAGNYREELGEIADVTKTVLHGADGDTTSYTIKGVNGKTASIYPSGEILVKNAQFGTGLKDSKGSLKEIQDFAKEYEQTATRVNNLMTEKITTEAKGGVFGKSGELEEAKNRLNELSAQADDFKMKLIDVWDAAGDEQASKLFDRLENGGRGDIKSLDKLREAEIFADESKVGNAIKKLHEYTSAVEEVAKAQEELDFSQSADKSVLVERLENAKTRASELKSELKDVVKVLEQLPDSEKDKYKKELQSALDLEKDPTATASYQVKANNRDFTNAQKALKNYEDAVEDLAEVWGKFENTENSQKPEMVAELEEALAKVNETKQELDGLQDVFKNKALFSDQESKDIFSKIDKLEDLEAHPEKSNRYVQAAYNELMKPIKERENLQDQMNKFTADEMLGKPVAETSLNNLKQQINDVSSAADEAIQKIRDLYQAGKITDLQTKIAEDSYKQAQTGDTAPIEKAQQKLDQDDLKEAESNLKKYEQAVSEVARIQGQIAANKLQGKEDITLVQQLQEAIDKANEAKTALLGVADVFNKSFVSKDDQDKYQKRITDADEALKHPENTSEYAANEYANIAKSINDCYEAAQKLYEVQEKFSLGEATQRQVDAASDRLNKTYEIANKGMKRLEEMNKQNSKNVSDNTLTQAKDMMQDVENIKNSFQNVSVDFGFETIEKGFQTLIKNANTYAKIVQKRNDGKPLNYSELQFLDRYEKKYDDAIKKAGLFTDAQNKAAEASAKFDQEFETAQANAFAASLGEIEKELLKLNALYVNQDGQDAIDKLRDKYNDITEAVKKYGRESQEVLDRKNIYKNAVKEFGEKYSSGYYTQASDEAIATTRRRMAEYAFKNPRDTETIDWINSIKDSLDGISAAGLDDVNAKLEEFKAKALESGNVGKTFGDTLKKSFQGLARYLMTYVGFYEVINTMKQAVGIVRDLDTAFTEMRKVSDEPLSVLREFSTGESFNIANQVGTTAQQIQQSTADFLRLGESFNEAKQSAKEATVLLNVSEFQDINAATESLTAMSQAYKELDKAEIVDKLNYIGNNYSISTSELAESLQKSAGTLKVAGDSIDEAIALTTAGNAVLQDPLTVGQSLKTIALRLNGTTAEEMQEIGEETDGLIATKSKLQKTIKDLTKVESNGYRGFDILDENGNYKSTYEKLEGIAKVYKEIGEEDKKFGTNRQSLLLETIAGK